jgi:hypothetical protein
VLRSVGVQKLPHLQNISSVDSYTRSDGVIR